MSYSDVMAVPEQGAHEPPPAAPERGSGRLPRFGRHTIASIVTTLVLAVVATLVGPLGGLSAAQAQGRNPTFKIGEMNRWGYWDFLNQIRRQVNASNNHVPGSSNTVDHTSNTGNSQFFDVDVQMWGNEQFVRIRLRRSDLYFVGWWSSDQVYNRLDTEAASGTPQNGNAWASNRRTIFDGDYPSLEGRAGATRAELSFNRDALSSAAWNLYNARQPTDRNGGNQARREIQTQAHAVLMMTQFISEAVRFRGVGNRLGWANEPAADSQPVHVPWQVTGEENNWGSLSTRFNQWLGRTVREDNPNAPDPNTSARPRVWTVDQFNQLVAFTLVTLADYARILNTAKSHP